MEISKQQNGSALIVCLGGRLDAVSAPDLDAAWKDCLDGTETITLDFEKLDYISSAGLRVLLAAKKKIGPNGTIRVLHAKESIVELLEITGFLEILDVDQSET